MSPARPPYIVPASRFSADPDRIEEVGARRESVNPRGLTQRREEEVRPPPPIGTSGNTFRSHLGARRPSARARSRLRSSSHCRLALLAPRIESWRRGKLGSTSRDIPGWCNRESTGRAAHTDHAIKAARAPSRGGRAFERSSLSPLPSYAEAGSSPSSEGDHGLDTGARSLAAKRLRFGWGSRAPTIPAGM